MQNHTLKVLGLEVSFRAEADPERVGKACSLLEEKFAKIQQAGGHLSKEKLLTFLALGLADDVLILREEKNEADDRLQELLVKIDMLAK